MILQWRRFHISCLSCYTSSSLLPVASRSYLTYTSEEHDIYSLLAETSTPQHPSEKYKFCLAQYLGAFCKFPFNLCSHQTNMELLLITKVSVITFPAWAVLLSFQEVVLTTVTLDSQKAKERWNEAVEFPRNSPPPFCVVGGATKGVRHC